MQWFKDRLNALIDNLLWFLVLGVAAVAVAVGASLWAWGSKDANLPIWAVVLFGAVQVACIVAITVLFLRTRTRPSIGLPQERPHPHAALLARIDALGKSLAEGNQHEAVAWNMADTFNRILSDARNEARRRQSQHALSHIAQLEPSDYDDRYGDENYGSVRATLRQVRAVVAHDYPPTSD
jgi:hypothetical protein